MKIVVDELPERVKDCLFAKYDETATGFGIWHSCGISGGTYCYVEYGRSCPYLTTENNNNEM